MQRQLLAGASTALALGALASCTSDSTGPGSPNALPTGVLYVEGNDPTAGQNAVLAYRRAADGSLTPLPGSPFRTGGTGVANPTQMLGPDDADQTVVADSARRVLYVVNGGSNTIAVLHIAADGSLTPVAGSPFPSGGVDPSSVGLAGNRLVVVNKAQDPAQNAGGGTPNYTVFSIGGDGALTPVPESTVTSVPGASPSQALVTPGGVVIGADFLAPIAPAPAGSLRAFALSTGGTLPPAPGTPLQLPGGPAMMRVALGLGAHPSQPVVYVGFTLQNKLGVYTYGPDGALTYVTAVANSGMALCWVRPTRTGATLYTSNTLTNSVSRYDATNALSPVERQQLVLREPGPTYPLMGMQVPTSQAFQLALAPDERTLYVVSQHTNPDFTAANGNWLHTVAVAADGTMSETVAPLQLPGGTRVRPQGVVAF